MASRNMTNFARLAATPAGIIDPGDYGGMSRHDYDEIVTDGTENTGERLFRASHLRDASNSALGASKVQLPSG